MTQNPSDLDITPPRQSPWRNLSVVWIIPLIALIVSLAVAWRSYADRGVLIEIAFENGAGVTQGETTLRYRDVTVGTVEDISFSADLSEVIIGVRVKNDVAPYLNQSARFWVVRPQVTSQGISGLSTVLTGAYIEGDWDGTEGAALRKFKGLETSPLIGQDKKGTRITLNTPGGTRASAGAPILYRGITVGRTEKPRLNSSGSTVVIDAFIDAPHDALLTTATRFWDISGFSVSFGAGGVKLDVENLSTLVSGGIAFNTFFSGGDPVQAGQVFDLYGAEADARENVFAKASTQTVPLAAIFDSGVTGLKAGARVEFEGVPIGKVTTLSAFVETEDETPQVKQEVTFSVDPVSLGLPANAGRDQVLDFLDTAIAGGVRARLATANFLGTALQIELVKIDDPTPATLKRDGDPFPIVPSVAPRIPDLNASLEGAIKRVDGLRIEDLIEQAISVMASIEAVTSDKNTREVPKAVMTLLDDARDVLTSDDTRAIPGEVRAALDQLRSAVTAVTQNGTMERLASTIDSADTAAINIAAASQEFPDLVSELRSVAEKANNLSAEELIEAATRFLDSADAVIGTEQAKALPDSINQALDQMRDVLAELRQGGAVENTNEALASARAAAESLERASADLPALTARLDSLVTRSEQLIAAYGSRSDFNDETLAMLREVRAAARTVASLTRALERSPNSILFGR